METTPIKNHTYSETYKNAIIKLWETQIVLLKLSNK